VAALVPLLVSTLYYNITLNQYDRIIENVYSANSLSSRLQGEIYTTMWNVVRARRSFGDNLQYELMDRIRGRLDELRAERQQRGQQLPDPGCRQHAGNDRGLRGRDRRQYRQEPRPVRENEQILGEISSVSELLYDVIQEFVAAEVEIAHFQNTRIQRSIDLMTLLPDRALASILIFLFRNYKGAEPQHQRPDLPPEDDGLSDCPG
jgi:two-component system sensor histidine kinase YesM